MNSKEVRLKEITALLKSMEHWYDNYRKAQETILELPDLYSEKCECCRVFFDEDNVDNECDSCPVQQHSGSPYCRDTPYGEAHFLLKLRETFGDNDSRERKIVSEVKKEYTYLAEIYLKLAEENLKMIADATYSEDKIAERIALANKDLAEADKNVANALYELNEAIRISTDVVEKRLLKSEIQRLQSYNLNDLKL